MSAAPTSPALTPSLRLDGARAAVTGAGGGLGRGFATALAEAGADLLLLDIRPEALAETVEAVERIGRSAQAIGCDITDVDQVAPAFEAVDRVDVLVNNAGTNVPQPLIEVTEDAVDLMLALNVKGTLLVAQAAARKMVRAGSGSIVNITSQMGHVGSAGRTVYCTTKHAVEGMTKAMAVELAPAGVRVNAVAPTFVETPMTRPFFEDPAFRADVLSRIPLGRLGQVEDIVGAVVFLASPAAGLITGTSLRVDGGWTAI